MGTSNVGTKNEHRGFAEKVKSLKEIVKEHPWKTLALVLGTLYITGIICLGINGIIVLPKVMSGELDNPFTMNPIKAIVEVFTTIKGYIILLIIILTEWYIYQFVIKPRIKIEVGELDDRGVRFKSKTEGTYGTSTIITDPHEIDHIIDVKPVGETNGIILGKPMYVDTTSFNDKTPDSEKAKIEVIALCSDKEYFEKKEKQKWNIDSVINNKLNKNMAVFGASGTMKSRALARNLIIQAVLRGESIIITDPKGELYEDCAKYCAKHGYDVRMFNLVDQKHSDSWNCLLELLDDNGVVDSTNAKIFADTVITNAQPNGKGDSYWNDNAANMLKAVCMYVAQDPILPKNMGTVYDIISQKTTAEIDALFKTLEPNNVARRAYSIFSTCTEQVKGQILNGLGIMIDVFQDDNIRNITSANEISLSKPITEKCAYFCITSDQHRVFDFVAVLFYAMLFIKLVSKADNLRGKQKTIPVNLILDEFPNIGQIPDFCKKISTVRSRNINITVIFQNIVQLQNRYPMGQWEEILGNCDTTVFLGCTDETTAKYISDKTGIATIEVTTQNTKYERDVMVFNQNTSYNEVRSSGQRKVMNPDEVLTLKNTEELLFFRGQSPLKAKKFDYSLHPESSKLEKMKIENHIPDWKQKQIDEENEKARLREERRKIKEAEHEKELEKIKEEEKKRQEDEKNSITSIFSSKTLNNNLFNPPSQRK